MSRWFRHYAGMMRDEKLVAVAIRSKQPVERVVWVWGAILESAAEIDDVGRFELDAAEVAYFLRTDEIDIQSILDALANAGRLATDRVVKWGDRQYQSDKSAERQARYRERRRSQNVGSDDQQTPSDVTKPSRDGVVTLQEAETDTDKKQEPTGSSKKRGTRLSDDFSPDIAAAIEVGLSEAEAEREALKFRDYWISQPGQKGVKLDWLATWRNWCRHAVERRPQQRSGSPPPGRRMNAVEAYISMKSEANNEPASRTIDHRDVERVQANEPRLQALIGNLGEAMQRPFGSGNH